MIPKDILRGQYQQLSADPNSLANLDQGELSLDDYHFTLLLAPDLPNNLQRMVPIVSTRPKFRH